jgi:endoglucanase
MNVFRLPFRWERLQPVLGQPLDPAELERLQTTTADLRALESTVILDVHNYARYRGAIVGSPELPASNLADLWRRLAEIYRTDPEVVFGLMNEPHEMPTAQWVEAANVVIAAIRATGAANLILVPGNRWTGAHSWSQGEQPNSELMLGIHDPVDHFAFEVHQYLDADASGSADACVSESIGVERMAGFTEWAARHGFKAFVGEFNGGANTICEAAVRRMLDHVERAPSVYLGWTWWAAGPWWGDSPRVLEPNRDGSDKPQMKWLEGYLSAP